MVRLQKIIAQAGICSRRNAEKLILDARVKVNGKIVDVLGLKVNPEKDEISVDGHVITFLEDIKYYLFYKPEGYLTALKDPKGRPTVNYFLEQLPVRVYPVGRLDMDVSGILILTNDGELARRLMHPKFGVSKTYWAKVDGVPDGQDMEKLRNETIVISDKKIAKAEAELIKKTQTNAWLSLTLTEGRHRQVKRMCQAIGHPVLRLKRIIYAGFLDLHGMQKGDVRSLRRSEVLKLKKMVNL